MQIFTIKQDGFKEIKRQMLIRTIPLMLVAAVVGVVISSINSTDAAKDINIWPFMIPFIILTVGWGLYRGVNRQKELFDSYTLKITNDLITREQLNTPTISIYLTDIQEIVRQKNGGFTIKGNNSTELILIPAQVDNYSQLETTLQAIQQITTQNKLSLFQKYQSLAGLLTVGLMFCVYTVNNKLIVALTSTSLLALMIWSFIKIRSN